MHRLMGSMKTNEYIYMDDVGIEEYSGMAFVRAFLSPAVIVVLVAVAVVVVVVVVVCLCLVVRDSWALTNIEIPASSQTKRTRLASSRMPPAPLSPALADRPTLRSDAVMSVCALRTLPCFANNGRTTTLVAPFHS